MISEVVPKWKIKVRRMKSGTGGREKLIKIPKEVANYFENYAILKYIDGKLVIEPYNEDSTPAGAESDNPSFSSEVN